MSKKGIKGIMDELQIDTSNTGATRKEKVFTKISDVAPDIKNYNFMMDLLVMPITKKKNRYILVVVDLASHEFDIEPLKTKTPTEVLSAFKKMVKRKILSIPESSISTDSGTEFKGVFDKFLKENKVFHKKTVPGRHSQNSMVESLNRVIARILNGYMNKKEEETGEPYNEWDDKIDFVRTKLNTYRERELPKKDEIHEIPPQSFLDAPKTSKFKEGDMVYFKLDRPQNALGNLQNTEKFREGDLRWDKFPKKIVRVLRFAGAVPFRYLLEGMENVSYTEKQLKKAKGKQNTNQTLFEVKRIIGRKKVGKGKNIQYNYKVWFKGYKKADATFINEKSLREDDLGKWIDEYDAENPR
jgi:hypothetical protein